MGWWERGQDRLATQGRDALATSHTTVCELAVLLPAPGAAGAADRAAAHLRQHHVQRSLDQGDVFAEVGDLVVQLLDLALDARLGVKPLPFQPADRLSHPLHVCAQRVQLLAEGFGPDAGVFGR